MVKTIEELKVEEKETLAMEFFKDAFCAKGARLLRFSEASKYKPKGVIEIVTGDKRGTIYIANMEQDND
tara:strand:- start:231 stop:437 length:207 start_codon:yes stop_codon:yes gene_type:complete